jgi:hypothetical protein
MVLLPPIQKRFCLLIKAKLIGKPLSLTYFIFCSPIASKKLIHSVKSKRFIDTGFSTIIV